MLVIFMSVTDISHMLSSAQLSELRTVLLTYAETESARHGSWKDDLSNFTFDLFNQMKTFMERTSDKGHNCFDKPKYESVNIQLELDNTKVELEKTKVELEKTKYELDKTTTKLEKASGICYSKTDELAKTKLELIRPSSNWRSQPKSVFMPNG